MRYVSTVMQKLSWGDHVNLNILLNIIRLRFHHGGSSVDTPSFIILPSAFLLYMCYAFHAVCCNFLWSPEYWCFTIIMLSAEPCSCSCIIHIHIIAFLNDQLFLYFCIHIIISPIFVFVPAKGTSLVTEFGVKVFLFNSLALEMQLLKVVASLTG